MLRARGVVEAETGSGRGNFGGHQRQVLNDRAMDALDDLGLGVDARETDVPKEPSGKGKGVETKCGLAAREQEAQESQTMFWTPGL